MSHFKGRDIVSIDHFTVDELAYLIAKAESFKKSAPDTIAKGKKMAYAFFEASTRTRISFLAAASNIGMARFGFGSAESTSLKKDESTGHTLKMLEGYMADALVIRHSLDGAAQYAADKLEVPVINAGDGRHEHPTQTLVDLMSIIETQGKLSGLKIALVGDLKYGRTVHSLVKAIRQFPENTFKLVSPKELELPEQYTNGHSDTEITDLEKAIRTCDIIYMTRIQLERIEDPRERQEVLGQIQLRPEMFDKAKPNLKVLHPLPIDATHPEISKTFDRERPNIAYYFQQAANGLPIREVILAAVTGAIGDDFKGKGYTPPVYNECNSLIPLKLGGKKRKYEQPKEEYVVKPVFHGTVIDHVPDQLGWKLAHALGMDDSDRFSRGRVVYAQGLHSASLNSKEIMMLHNHELSEAELRIVAMVAPGVTINIVRNGAVTAKYKTQLPDVINGILQCDNKRCISNDPKEDAPGRFYVRNRNTAELSCHYCDTMHGMEKGNLKTVLK
jgi:aspartate carbamoyltransferase catalytic subunit